MVKEKHIEFLKEWFSKDKNVGQPFKSAYSDLKLKFKDDKLPSEHGCYKSFKKNSGFTFKRI